MFEILFPVAYVVCAIVNLVFFGLMIYGELQKGLELKSLIVGVFLTLFAAFVPLFNNAVTVLICCYLFDTAKFFQKKITIGAKKNV